MRQITKDRLERLEKDSEYYRNFMFEVHKDLNKLLTHLGVRVETVERHRVIKPLCQGDKKEETKK